jgi:hypothetical protein
MREQKPGIFELLKLQFIWRPFVAGLHQAINDGLPAAPLIFLLFSECPTRNVATQKSGKSRVCPASVFRFGAFAGKGNVHELGALLIREP